MPIGIKHVDFMRENAIGGHKVVDKILVRECRGLRGQRAEGENPAESETTFRYPHRAAAPRMERHRQTIQGTTVAHSAASGPCRLRGASHPSTDTLQRQ